MRDPRRTADELARECLEPPLDARGRALLRSGLLRGRAVAKAAEDEPQVLGLLPVVVAVAGVIRAGEVLLGERLRDDDLPASRRDRAIERFQEPVRVPVRREHDLVRIQLLDRTYRVVLPDLRSRIGSSHCEPAHPAARVNRSVRRMEDRALEAIGESPAELGPPFDLEAVLA